MVRQMKARSRIRIAGRAIVTLAAAAVWTGTVRANAAGAAHDGPHHSFLGGPWELVVKMGLEGDGLRFPLTVPNEDKPHKFDTVLPVKGTAIEVKLEEYVPDLKWETVAVKHPGDGIAAKLVIRGKTLEQEVWLSPDDPARQSVSSSIGGVAIKRLRNPDTAEALVRGLTHPKAVGILSVWPEDGNRPFEWVAKTAETRALPASKYKLTVMEYVPHYSIDTQTKKVVSQSEKPVNPAVKIAVDDGRRISEQWLWARFPSSPHQETKLPLRMRFTDVDLRGDQGSYILVVTGGVKVWVLSSNNGEKRVEEVVLGRSYPFANKEYGFTLETVMDEAIIKTEWKNGSERLLSPALVTTIEEKGTSSQTVLELNKPFHHKTKSGTLVLLYRRTPASIGAVN